MESLIGLIFVIAIISYVANEIAPFLVAFIMIIILIVLLCWALEPSKKSANKSKNTDASSNKTYKTIESEKKLLQMKINDCKRIEQGNRLKEDFLEFQDAIANAQYVHDKKNYLSDIEKAKSELIYAKEKFLSSNALEQSLIFIELPKARTKDVELGKLIDKLLIEMNVLDSIEPANNRIIELISKMKKEYYPTLYEILKKFNSMAYLTGTEEYQKILLQSNSAVYSIYGAIKMIEKENANDQSSDISIKLKVMDSLLEKDGLSSKNQIQL